MATQNHYLNIRSWNATGIMSSSSYLCKTLSRSFKFFCLRLPGRRRVGKGGVAILWHKRHNGNIVPLF